MKSILVSRLSNKYLLPYLPEFKIKGHLLYDVKIDYFLGGVWFESSAYQKDDFTIEIFVQPLFIPDEYLAFNFGTRLKSVTSGCEMWWKYSEEHESEIMEEVRSLVVEQGMGFLRERLGLNNFLKAYGDKYDSPNINNAEALCYAGILYYPNRRREMIDRLNDLKNNLKKKIAANSDILWYYEVKNRVDLISRYIENNERIKAIDQLNEWRDYTLAQLKILRE